jgi:hypothetical protein
MLNIEERQQVLDNTVSEVCDRGVNCPPWKENTHDGPFYFGVIGGSISLDDRRPYSGHRAALIASFYKGPNETDGVVRRSNTGDSVRAAGD